MSREFIFSILISLLIVTSGNTVFAEEILGAQTFIARGDEYYSVKLYKKSVIAYSKAIEMNPHSGSLYLKRGAVYKDAGIYGKALKDYNKALLYEIVYTDAVSNRAYILMKMNLYLSAIEDYSRLIMVNPFNYEAYYNRGSAYMKTKNYNKALDDFHLVAEHDPFCVKTSYNLSCIYAIRGDSEKSINYLKQGITNGFDDLELLKISNELSGIRNLREFKEIVRLVQRKMNSKLSMNKKY